MFYYNYKPDDNSICISKGICSAAPDITALQEVMLVMLRALSYYVIKLELLGAKNERIKIDMAYNIVYLSTLQEYTDEQVLQIINGLFSNLMNTEKIYKTICKEKGITFEKYNSPIRFENNMDLNKLIGEGEKVYRNKFKSLDNVIKNYAEILLSIVKSLSFLAVELDDNQSCDSDELNEIIRALNIYNQRSISEEKLRKLIYELSDLNAELMFKLNGIKRDKFGEIQKKEVSQSTEKGKAILVSGNNLAELEETLQNVRDKDINVYTNGNLLIAHAYSKFNEYENLKGHFGNGVETSVLDFATFPGAILLTKNEAHNIEYLYRGRLFTTDELPPRGVAKLAAENLEPLIEGAMSTKGFARAHNRAPVTVGFDINEVDKKFDEIAAKLIDGTYQYLFIIGLANPTASLDEYFNNFFKAKPENSAVISFSYTSKCDNIYSINVANDYSLATMLLFRLFEKVPIDSPKVTLFLTKCDNSAFAGMIRLSHRGAKNIFMSNCQPNIMNPATLKAFKKFYNINNMTTATADIKRITKKETG